MVWSVSASVWPVVPRAPPALEGNVSTCPALPGMCGAVCRNKTLTPAQATPTVRVAWPDAGEAFKRAGVVLRVRVLSRLLRRASPGQVVCCVCRSRRSPQRLCLLGGTPVSGFCVCSVSLVWVCAFVPQGSGSLVGCVLALGLRRLRRRCWFGQCVALLPVHRCAERKAT